MLSRMLLLRRAYPAVARATPAIALTLAVGRASFSAPAVSPSRPPVAAPPALLPGGAVSVVLYQYETCPFCNKLRAYLDAVRVPYVLVEVDPLRKGELAWWPDYQKVPLAVVNGVVVTDSSHIIDTVDALLRARGGARRLELPLAALTPLASASAAEAARRAWVDDVLVKLLTVNIYRNWGEALSTFEYLTQRNFPAWSVFAAKYVGAVAMLAVARKRRAALNLPAGVDERRALIDALDGFVNDMGAAPFAGGSAPDIGDISVFGVLRAIDGLPTHTDVLAGRLAPWYARMSAALGPSSATHRVFEAPRA